MKRSVTVDVVGQKLQLRTDADESYVAALAEFVSEKIGEVKSTSRTYSTGVLAVLAALNIADELFQLRQREAELRQKVREKSQRLLELLENGSEPG